MEGRPRTTHKPRALFFSFAILAVAVITGAGVAPPANAQSPIFTGSGLDYNVGLSVGENLMGLDSTSLNNALNDIASLHIGMLRFDITWSDVQSIDSSHYDWSAIDRFVSAANAHGFQLLAMIGYTPAWARPSWCTGSNRCPPADPNAFANFAKQAVLRYSPQGVMKWEIWNEENQAGSWGGPANPAYYASMLKAVYPVIRAAQPWAGVIIGGMSPAASNGNDISPIDYLTALYANGAKPYFNAVGFHPYSFPVYASNYQIWNAFSQMSGTPVNLRTVMIANGDGGKRIWSTEYGAPTGGPGNVASDGWATSFLPNTDHVTETLQANMIADALYDVQGVSWAGPMFLYSYKDLGTNTNTVENFFGIRRADGSAKPVYTTLQGLLQ